MSPTPPSPPDAYMALDGPFIHITWQRGTVDPVRGPTGAQPEDVLAAVQRRIAYLDGRLACEENAEALAAIEMALVALARRTAHRVAAGVEGTETPH
jgi:hypothetical protein